MRSLALFLLGAHAWAEPSGKWGEKPSLVPSFSLPQERRAPKLPANSRVFKQTAPLDGDSLVEGLLICFAEIGFKHGAKREWGMWGNLDNLFLPREDWDLFNGPDTVFEWRIGAQKITQWGPEDHWRMFISIPRLDVRRGDRIEVRVWDRDVTTREYIGAAQGRFDGHFPLVLESRFLHLECRALSAEQASAEVAPRLEQLDKDLLEIEEAVPREAAPTARWGAVAPLLEKITGEWQGSFRYVAGHIGWEDPRVQARLARLAAAEKAWLDATAKLPPPGQGVSLRKTGDTQLFPWKLLLSSDDEPVALYGADGAKLSRDAERKGDRWLVSCSARPRLVEWKLDGNPVFVRVE